MKTMKVGIWTQFFEEFNLNFEQFCSFYPKEITYEVIDDKCWISIQKMMKCRVCNVQLFKNAMDVRGFTHDWAFDWTSATGGDNDPSPDAFSFDFNDNYGSC